MMLNYLYTNRFQWYSKAIVPLENLIEEYKESIKLSHIGFPLNWKELLSGKIKFT